MGTCAEFWSLLISQSGFPKKACNISFEEAAGLPIEGYRYQAFGKGVVSRKVIGFFIHAGSGGVGSFANFNMPKAKGAYVYTTTSTKNVDWVKALGLTVHRHKKEDYKSHSIGLKTCV